MIGRVGGDGGPPLHFVGFVEVDADVFAGGGGLQRPGGLGGADFVGEVALVEIGYVSDFLSLRNPRLLSAGSYGRHAGVFGLETQGESGAVHR